MTPDLDKYRSYIKGHALTPEQEDRLIHSLWQTLERLADRAFGLDPVSLARERECVSDSFDRASAVGSDHNAAHDQQDAPVRAE